MSDKLGYSEDVGGLTPRQMVELNVSPLMYIGSMIVSLERELEHITDKDTISSSWEPSKIAELKKVLRKFQTSYSILQRESGRIQECTCYRRLDDKDVYPNK